MIKDLLEEKEKTQLLIDELIRKNIDLKDQIIVLERQGQEDEDSEGIE